MNEVDRIVGPLEPVFLKCAICGGDVGHRELHRVVLPDGTSNYAGYIVCNVCEYTVAVLWEEAGRPTSRPAHLDFMFLLEEATCDGIITRRGDLLHAYDRPARVYRDAKTMKYIAEPGHEQLLNWVSRLIRYKNLLLLIENVEITVGEGPRITAREIERKP